MTTTTGRRPGSSPGANLQRVKMMSLPAPEDLGAKKMEAPRGAGTEKLSVPIRPPWKRWGTAHTLLRRILGREEAMSPAKKNPEGCSRQNLSSPRVHLWYPLSLYKEDQGAQGRG